MPHIALIVHPPMPNWYVRAIPISILELANVYYHMSNSKEPVLTPLVLLLLLIVAYVQYRQLVINFVSLVQVTDMY